MASIPSIIEGRFPARVTVAIAVNQGDLLAYNGSAWVKADADTPASLYARLIAGETVDGSLVTTCQCYREALVYDADAPYTVDAKQYLSGTAGAHTETRPAVTKLVQVVGQALSTDTVHLRCAPLREVEVPLHLNGATSAFAQLDSGNFAAPTLDAQSEVAALFCIVPDGAVSVELAQLFLAAEASAGTPTFNLAVSSAIDGVQWDAVTADTLATGPLEGAAADEIQVTDISTALNGTNIIRPGAGLGVLATKDDGGTDISLIFGGRIVFNCV